MLDKIRTAKSLLIIGCFVYKASAIMVDNVKSGKTLFGKKRPMRKKTVVWKNNIYIGTNDARVA